MELLKHLEEVSFSDILAFAKYIYIYIEKLARLGSLYSLDPNKDLVLNNEIQ